MVGKVRTVNPDLYVRRCVACGYDGALLQNGRAERCARCGCDLHLRPARSYAEMEGLIGQPIEHCAKSSIGTASLLRGHCHDLAALWFGYSPIPMTTSW